MEKHPSGCHSDIVDCSCDVQPKPQSLTSLHGGIYCSMNCAVVAVLMYEWWLEQWSRRWSGVGRVTLCTGNLVITDRSMWSIRPAVNLFQHSYSMSAVCRLCYARLVPVFSLKFNLLTFCPPVLSTCFVLAR